MAPHPSRAAALRTGLAALLASSSPGIASAQHAGLRELEAAARQEGSLVVDGPPVAELRQALSAGFQQAYGIPISYISSGGSRSSARVRAERAAGKYLLDVFITGSDSALNSFLPSGWLDPIEPVLVAPEVLDRKKWRDGHLWYADPHHVILRLLGFVTPEIAVNNKLLPAASLRSWKQLIDPKWRGKIIAQDPRVAGGGATTPTYLYKYFGPEYVRALYVDQQPFISTDGEQAARALAQGSYVAWVGAYPAALDPFEKAGYPIAYVSPSDAPEIFSGGFGLVCLMNRAPHENAAKLFVNWLAGRAGVSALGSCLKEYTLRTDIDQSWAQPYSIPQRGKHYLDAYEYDFVTQIRSQTYQKVQELLDR
jgi:iron(III) transport system substrate-binding protein